jgi:hypothetical protein
MGVVDPDAEIRRQRRAGCIVTVVRHGDPEQTNDDDALYWDRIPVDERAGVVWELSQEVYALAPTDAPAKPGLSRSIVRIVRG